MKITFILPVIGISGGTRVVFELANRLKNRGHEVAIVYPLMLLKITPKFSLKNFIKQIGYVLLNIKQGVKVNWMTVKAKLIRIPTLSPRFVHFFEDKIPDGDIIIATSWETAYPVSKLSERKGKKFYFVQHYEVWDVWNNIEYWERAEKFAENKNKLYLFMADIVPENYLSRKQKELVDNTYRLPLKKITTSLWLKELIERKFGENVERITLGVNFDDFYLENKKPKRKKIILIPYRSLKWKGEEDGISALKIVKEKFPDVEIIMYGTKKDSCIPSWIKFHKRVFGEELRKLYCSSDIFVSPSWIEGWGLPPMEAMACGVACVITDTGGVSEYTIPGKTAFIVPPRNPEKLAKAILDLLEDDEKRQRIAKAGYEYILQFIWDKTIDQLEKILKKALP